MAFQVSFGVSRLTLNGNTAYTEKYKLTLKFINSCNSCFLVYQPETFKIGLLTLCKSFVKKPLKTSFVNLRVQICILTHFTVLFCLLVCQIHVDQSIIKNRSSLCTAVAKSSALLVSLFPI